MYNLTHSKSFRRQLDATEHRAAAARDSPTCRRRSPRTLRSRTPPPPADADRARAARHEPDTHMPAETRKLRAAAHRVEAEPDRVGGRRQWQ